MLGGNAQQAQLHRNIDATPPEILPFRVAPQSAIQSLQGLRQRHRRGRNLGLIGKEKGIPAADRRIVGSKLKIALEVILGFGKLAFFLGAIGLSEQSTGVSPNLEGVQEIGTTPKQGRNGQQASQELDVQGSPERYFGHE